jgi:hypothetical protein
MKNKGMVMTKQKSQQFSTLDGDDLSILHYAMSNLKRDFPYPADGTDLEKMLNKRVTRLIAQLKYEINLKDD